MKTAIAVQYTESDGLYEIMGHPESWWEEVKANADSVEHVEKLRGWGCWADAYRVTFGGEVWFYFVD